jgi:hypothetical protein
MTRIMGFQFRGGRTQTIEHIVAGLCIRESSTGKAIVWGKDYNQGTKLAAYRYTNATTSVPTLSQRPSSTSRK